MDILLDTHVFLWWDARSPRLGEAARRVIAAPANRIYVSAASIWEIAIKRLLRDDLGERRATIWVREIDRDGRLMFGLCVAGKPQVLV